MLFSQSWPSWMFPHQVSAIQPKQETDVPQLRIPLPVASPSWLHSLWRQVQGCILFLPSQVSSPSVSRLSQLPGTPQKSEVGGRGGKEAKRKEIMKMEEKRNCTTLRRPLRRIAFPYWYSQLIFMCCIFRNIAFLTRPLICSVYTLAF